MRRALEPLGPQVTVQLFSSLKKTGVEEVERVIGGWLVPPGTTSEDTAGTPAAAGDASAAEKTKAPDQGT